MAFAEAEGYLLRQCQIKRDLSAMAQLPMHNLSRYFKTSLESVRCAVMRYIRFSPSPRIVEEL